ncbi:MULTISPECIES: antitoxin Xre/MbcA/ParS toxin-binding domain-containing protein [Methylobacterium]|uniref:antitoxin Xre/MbcA/ParS toxin-binding domain-containing protein n=1 Tax=Methylobacterium TaxID=407 RepID=UPI0013E9A958|nr:antitoxin Xre/MbcA/ParS toxin-binding domain-containing protein [Methylobacterium sp. DB0501]NGM37033.1 DUF2384 domain-containing protein [Methylobacterium sp. DB0501]
MTTTAEVRRGHPNTLISQFLGEVQEPRQSYISSERFAERLGMSKMALAKVAGVHRNTLHANPNSEQLQDRLREITKILMSASELTGDIETATYWLKNEPIKDYRGKTPIELVASGHCEAVLAYIEDIKNGAIG